MADAPVLTFLLHHNLQVLSPALLMVLCTDVNLASKAWKQRDPKAGQAALR